MNLKNNNIYQVYTDPNTKKMHYYENGKYHREDGPAVVIAEDIEKYSNLGDESLYIPIDLPMFQPENIRFDGTNITKIVVSLMMESSKYFLEGVQYSEQEFNALILKKELDSHLFINNATTKKPKL